MFTVCKICRLPVLKHSDLRQLGEGEGLFHLRLLGHTPLLKELRTGFQGRKLKWKQWRNATS